MERNRNKKKVASILEIENKVYAQTLIGKAHEIESGGSGLVRGEKGIIKREMLRANI
jgi:hypothetical protein